MLTRFWVHNFRSLLNAEFAFRPRHLVIGKNNSGKTNVVSAVRFLGATSSQELAEAARGWVYGGLSEMKNRAFASNVIELGCECELPHEDAVCQFKYELKIELKSDRPRGGFAALRLAIRHERLTVACPGFDRVALIDSDGHEAAILDEMKHSAGETAYVAKSFAPADATTLSKVFKHEANPRTFLFRSYLESWAYYSISPLAMRLWSRDAFGRSGLDTTGANLVGVIFTLKNLDELRYRKLIEHVSAIDPDIRAINFVPGLGVDAPALPKVVLQDGKEVSWEGLSDGTLRALAIHAIIELSTLGEPVPRLSLIEEPENGIAPAHLRRVFDAFEERAPQSQFVFTSHSPYFINLFDGEREAVTILKRGDERTEVGRPPAESSDPERFTLAEEYALELIA